LALPILAIKPSSVFDLYRTNGYTATA